MEPGGPNKPYVIDTASGVKLNLEDPQPEDIRIEDVAGGLSKVCRFAAQSLQYYSVAQHALLVRDLVAKAGYPELVLAALHHDSHEAYLCDIPKPLKSKISASTDAYDRVCDAFDVAIAEAFGFEYLKKDSQERTIIKRADNQAFLMEASQLLPDGSEALRAAQELDGRALRDLPDLDEPLAPTEAERRFLGAHLHLTGGSL